MCLHAEGLAQPAALAEPWGAPVATPGAGGPTAPAEPSLPPAEHILRTQEGVVACGFWGVCSE